MDESRVGPDAGTPEHDGDCATDWNADFITVPAPGSDLAVVVFTGLKQQVGIGVEQMHAHLRPLGAHFVALRDPGRQLFLAGLPYLGSHPDESAALLRRHLDGLGARRIVALGNSAGGLGALVFGARMRADAIVAYGAVTSIGQPFEPRGPALIARLRQLPGWDVDVAAELLAQPSPIPTMLAYGDAMDTDRRYAQLLAHVPGVRHAPIAGFDGHDVVPEKLRRGIFFTELRDFLADAGVIGPGSRVPAPDAPGPVVA